MENPDEKRSLESFVRDYAAIISFIKNSDEDRARYYFNETFSPSYKSTVNSKGSLLHSFLPYFIDMNEYLNNPATMVSGLVTKDLLIGEFFSDFQDVLRAVKREH